MSASEGTLLRPGRVERHVLGIDGLDQLREVVVGADLGFDQLRPGRMKARLARATVGPLTFDSCRYSLPVRSTGRGSSETFSFVLLRSPATFNGVALTAGDLVVYPPGSEFEGFSKTPFSDYVFTVRPDDLARFAASIGSDADPGDLKSFVTLPCSLRHSRRLSALGAALDRGDADVVADPAPTAAAILTCLCEILSSRTSSRTSHGHGAVRRTRPMDLVRKTEHFLSEQRDEPARLASICAALEVSARTLQLTFRSVTGLGPSEYGRVLRLQAARRELLRGLRGAQISDIALRHGFPHFGRFSAYYRAFFDETPSATLRRVTSS